MGFEIVEEEEAMNTAQSPLPLVSLNHVSFVCTSVSRSVRFYEEVLGFVSVKRPSSFDFHGAWLFNYGVGIHLLQCNNPEEVPKKKAKINPRDNHISFQCSNMDYLKHKLAEMGIEYVTAIVEDGGIRVDQLFFHDPDGYMVEICNCENLPVLPISTAPFKLPYLKDYPPPMLSSSIYGGNGALKFQFGPCRGEAEGVIMENLVTDMMDISF
ncbi:uncharacterized protein LOC109725910 [Ananas comosus]|uniref:Uncharacterized protein LOC109725910 n=1 Tax=Ananas comosus TaxID=4615 RepID=A0A6P5GQH4_ANACO|nr:uncharacterized protein LOC109725910 [Ananas comosus]